MTDAELKARFDRIDARQEALIAGCSEMNVSLATLRDAIGDLYQIINAPPSGELKEALERLFAGFETMTKGFELLAGQITTLPEKVASRVRAEAR